VHGWSVENDGRITHGENLELRGSRFERRSNLMQGAVLLSAFGFRPADFFTAKVLKKDKLPLLAAVKVLMWVQ
jgi:hypothetical protein